MTFSLAWRALNGTNSPVRIEPFGAAEFWLQPNESQEGEASTDRPILFGAFCRSPDPVTGSVVCRIANRGEVLDVRNVSISPLGETVYLGTNEAANFESGQVSATSVRLKLALGNETIKAKMDERDEVRQAIGRANGIKRTSGKNLHVRSDLYDDLKEKADRHGMTLPPSMVRMELVPADDAGSPALRKLASDVMRDARATAREKSLAAAVLAGK